MLKSYFPYFVYLLQLRSLIFYQLYLLPLKMNIRTPLLVLGLHLSELPLTIEVALNISCGFQQGHSIIMWYTVSGPIQSAQYL